MTNGLVIRARTAITTGSVPPTRCAGISCANSLEVGGVLPPWRQDRTERHGVDPDSRSERLGSSAGEGVERALRHRVGEMVGVGTLRSPIGDIHHYSLEVAGKPGGKRLGEEHRSGQIDGERPVPGLGGDVGEAIVGENRGAVDQHLYWRQIPGTVEDRRRINAEIARDKRNP